MRAAFPIRKEDNVAKISLQLQLLLILKCDNDANADDAAVSNDDEDADETLMKTETLQNGKKKNRESSVIFIVPLLLIYSPCRQTLTFCTTGSHQSKLCAMCAAIKPIYAAIGLAWEDGRGSLINSLLIRKRVKLKRGETYG